MRTTRSGRQAPHADDEPPLDKLALEAERFRALQRQIPLLYVIALTNVLGLQSVTGDVIRSVYHPANALIVLVIVRLVYWAKSRRRQLTANEISRELKRTYFLAGAISALFGIWAVLLFDNGDVAHRSSVVLFASLAAIGCAYGLSGFPAAARLPLLFAALPISARLALSSDPAHIGMGVSLGLIILLILRLLDIQNRGITQLVLSRAALERERSRARLAQREAQLERRQAELNANTDDLTGLASRRAFVSALSAAEVGDAVLLLDLNGFKPINDTFGHASGDEVLIEVGRRLSSLTTASRATIARLGGDEFAVLTAIDNAECAIELASSICAAISQPLHVRSRSLQVSASCGIALIEANALGLSALTQADIALYKTKQSGRGSVSLYSPEMHATAKRRLQIEASLKDDFIQESIDLVYQPIISLVDGSVRSFEALARWKDGDLGEISPCEFIPIAEQSNTIEALSSRLLRKAAREARQWPAPILLSFNISAAELCSCGAAARILKIIAGAELSPARLQVEITETVMLSDFGTAGVELDQLKSAGVLIVLDDFGAGYASISYLREMRLDGIKLDGQLLRSASESSDKRKLLKGVLNLCQSLELPCTAEHIETAEQLRLLQNYGCAAGQGHYLSHPLTAEEASRAASLHFDQRVYAKPIEWTGRRINSAA